MTEYRNPDFEIRGFNAFSLVCADMRETVDFYTAKLGMRLIGTDEDASGTQRFLVDVGNGVDRFEFLWFPDGRFAPGVATSDYLDGGMTWQPTGALVHLCLDVPDTLLDGYRENLKQAGVDVTLMRSDSSFHRSFYFKDPNGINIEVGSYTRPFVEEDLNYTDSAHFDVMERD